ncbi:MAG TPA: ATP-dependent helicase HrpB, partial [Actinomycetales bacterium]
ARRLAGLVGEPVGGTVGVTVRGERQVGRATRVEFVTTGVLLRRLQRDPELPGVHAVVVDEVHERQLDGDLAVAMLLDVRRNLRADLRLVAMSATVEAGRTAALLGDDEPAPVVVVPGSLHPVGVHWRPVPPRVVRTDVRGVTQGFLDHVAAVTREALREQQGDVLVFVPGVREIDATARRLAGTGVRVVPLHGRLAHREQDLALTGGGGRRVVVSTAVAESSLTVPGVRVVVDGGLARQPRTDIRRGLAGLVTVGVSRAAADQRAGRAGREAPGSAYRCWAQAEHERLPAHPEPEIATADLTAFALELACWGAPGGQGLSLLDPPPGAAMEAAHQVLQAIGAVTGEGAATARGRAISAVGADPRLARALIDGAPLVGATRAAEVVALLSDDVRAPGGDLVAALREARRGGPAGRQWATESSRLRASLDAGPAGSGTERLTDDLAVGLVVALAHPDRIARLRPGGSTYLMTSGTGAALPGDGAALTGAPWLAVADADRGGGRADALVRSAAPLDEHLALLAAPALRYDREQVRWQDGTVVATRSTGLGAIELSSAPLRQPPRGLVAAAVRDGLAAEGLALLPWSPAATALRARLAFLHRVLGAPWPEVSDRALLEDVGTWLAPDLDRVRGRRDLQRLDTVAALRRLLPWPAAAHLDEWAPERVTVPSGSAVRLDYDGEQPVLAVRLQEVFGWSRTPRIGNGRVPVLMHLLSPARRPVAVTSDLESFWRNTYPQVRGELRGRYPKHAWPDDPTTAPPTAGVRRPRRP